MKEISEMIFQLLSTNSSFIAEMGDKIFPLFAKSVNAFPLAVYNVGEVSPKSYDARSFPVLVSLCYSPESYTEAMDFADVVKDIFDGTPNCDYISTEPSFDEESQTIMININLLITK